MTNLYTYLTESRTIKDLGLDTNLLKRFIEEWVLTNEGYDDKKSDEAMDVYNDLVDALRPKVRNYKDGIKALYNYCVDFFAKLNECGLYNVTDEIMDLLIMRITEMPANKLENLLGAGEEGIVVELHDKVVKCFYGDKIPKNKLEYYKACKSGRYKVFPRVQRIGKGYVVMEKLKLFTPKCDEYQYYVDKLYWTFRDGNYKLDELGEKEQDVMLWLEMVQKAVQETTNFVDLGDLDEKNFGERENGDIVYFDV